MTSRKKPATPVVVSPNQARIITMLAEHLIMDKLEITPGSRFAEDLNADSLDFVEMIMLIEEEFEIPGIPDEDAEKLLTVGAVIDYVDKYARVVA